MDCIALARFTHTHPTPLRCYPDGLTLGPCHTEKLRRSPKDCGSLASVKNPDSHSGPAPMNAAVKATHPGLGLQRTVPMSPGDPANPERLLSQARSGRGPPPVQLLELYRRYLGLLPPPHTGHPLPRTAHSTHP